MFCYDVNGEPLGVISCIAEVGEEHYWGNTLYECIEVKIDNEIYIGTFRKIREE